MRASLQGVGLVLCGAIPESGWASVCFLASVIAKEERRAHLGGGGGGAGKKEREKGGVLETQGEAQNQ